VYLFNFDEKELILFFLVFIRFSILFSVLPFFSEKIIPSNLKIMLSLVVSLVSFPFLINSNLINIDRSKKALDSFYLIFLANLNEVFFSLVLGFTAKIIFEGINYASNFMGNLMGFAMASSYDHHQESQTQIVAQIQNNLVMLLFIALDGHHLILKSAINSYSLIGIGEMRLHLNTVHMLIKMTSSIFYFGLQLSAPMCIVIFGVNFIFGFIAKALPQLNVLAMSSNITAFLGLIVFFIGLPNLMNLNFSILENVSQWMYVISKLIAQ
jgi:flagellar biosynthetic protein FliR